MKILKFLEIQPIHIYTSCPWLNWYFQRLGCSQLKRETVCLHSTSFHLQIFWTQFLKWVNSHFISADHQAGPSAILFILHIHSCVQWKKNKLYKLIHVQVYCRDKCQIHCSNQASAGRRRPPRPGFSNSLPRDSWVLSEIFAVKHEGHGRKLRVRDDYKLRNEGLKDPGRWGCRPPEEPWFGLN